MSVITRGPSVTVPVPLSLLTDTIDRSAAGVSGSESLASTSIRGGNTWADDRREVVGGERRQRVGLDDFDDQPPGRDPTVRIADLVRDHRRAEGRAGSERDHTAPTVSGPEVGRRRRQHGQPRTGPVGVAVVGEHVDRDRAEHLDGHPLVLDERRGVLQRRRDHADDDRCERPQVPLVGHLVRAPEHTGRRRPAA